MKSGDQSNPSRRDVLKNATTVAAASALAGIALPAVHAQGSNTIQVALVGCGGRGTGAAQNALASPNGPTKLVAMADVFQNKLTNSHNTISRGRAAQVDAPEARRFLGFDGYRKAMDCLRPGDIVILATPPAFRWVQFAYAIEKRLNVFMEKPVTVDGPSTRRMLALAQRSEELGLKVGVGLMCRHCVARGELFNRIRNGEIGDLMLLRAYRMTGPEATCFSDPKPAGMNELLWQIQRFHSFIWASGGCYSDFLIHNIDECCWMKDAFPVSAKGSGGRHYRGNKVDQNFDHYSVEYTFADGAKLYLEGRNIPNCQQEFASYCHGTRGAAVISQSGHTPSRCRIFRGQDITIADNVTWRYGQNEPNPYQLEWDDLLNAIRRDQRYNEVRRGAEASLITSMGRMAAHTGQIVTRDQILNFEHELAPQVDRLTFESAAPVVADADGKYPVPMPGAQDRNVTRRREY